MFLPGSGTLEGREGIGIKSESPELLLEGKSPENTGARVLRMNEHRVTASAFHTSAPGIEESPDKAA